jgi:hypothetical protein
MTKEQLFQMACEALLAGASSHGPLASIFSATWLAHEYPTDGAALVEEATRIICEDVHGIFDEIEAIEEEAIRNARRHLRQPK